MDVSVVTRLVTEKIQLKLRPEVPAPGGPRCDSCHVSLQGTFALIHLPGLWRLGAGVSRAGDWSNRMQPQVDSAPNAPQTVTSFSALWAVGLQSCLGLSTSLGLGRVEGGWRAPGRGAKAISWPCSPSAANDPISIRGCTRSLPTLQSAPGAPIREGSSSRLCNGEWVM